MMRLPRNILNLAVTAIFMVAPLAVAAQTVPSDPVPGLLADLAKPENRGWRRVERQIIAEWSKSGSAALDLLLQRGRDALREDDSQAAIEHLTALTDHAPDFAEGWNVRATALFRAGYAGPAMADLARALALNPQNFVALSGVGTILADTGDQAGALAAYRAALAIHPHLERVRTAVERLERELAGQEL